MLPAPYAGRPVPTRQSQEAKIPKAKSASLQERQESDLNGPEGQELDPLIDALLEHLPAPGDHWPMENRKLWLQILELAFKLIYEEQPPENGDREPEARPQT